MSTRYVVSLGIASLLIACGNVSVPDDGPDTNAKETEGGTASGHESGSDVAGGEDAGGETGDPGAGDETGGTGDANAVDDGADDGRYTIRGRAELAGTKAPRAPSGRSSSTGPLANESCPFAPGSAPCVDKACVDDGASDACAAVVETHCEESPGDPACKPEDEGEGGSEGDGEGGSDGAQPDGGEWVCDVQPDWPPCEVCLDPDQSEDACPQAWNEFCNENPSDPWCEGPDDDDGGEPEATFPVASLSLLVHRVEFSLDAENCSDPILVAEHETPELVDFADNPTLLEGVPPAAGVYACVIITMSDNIQWSVEGDNACAGTSVQDVHGDETEETVRLHISTAGYGGSDGDHGSPFEAPGILLAAPLETGDGVVGSTFVVGFPEGVQLRRDGDEVRCGAQKPSFTFETTYE